MSGLEKDKIIYNYGLLKGRIGEAITEQVFREMNYRVFRYGMENTLPGLTQIIEGHKGEVIKSIRNQPDFVVCSKSGEWFFLEVKYRSVLKISLNELLKYESTQVQFIIITPGFIGSISRKEVQKKKNTGINILTNVAHLAECSKFNFSHSDKTIISQFEIYTEAFLKDLPSSNYICEQANKYV